MSALRLLDDAVDRGHFIDRQAGGWHFFPRALWPGLQSRGFVVADAGLRARLHRETARHSLLQFCAGAAMGGAWLVAIVTPWFWTGLVLGMVGVAAGATLEYSYVRHVRDDLRGLPVAHGLQPPSWQMIADVRTPTWRLRAYFGFAAIACVGLLARAGYVLADDHLRLADAIALAGMAALAMALAGAYALGLRTQALRQRNSELERLIAERTAELERVNRHKSEFLANMSHELRTPLNAIIGFSDVMLSGMVGTMPDKQKEFVGDIRDSGRHLLALINDILDLSKVEAGRMDLQRAPFDLEKASEDAVTLVRGRAERQGIELRVDVERGIGAIDADERKFKQILLNLLSNAVKFTSRGGVVTLAARRVDDAVRVSIADTGVGMSAEDLGAIFQEFSQVGNDPERRAEGTGLGLALTRRLVELHGGSIRVESAPGRGSTFTFELPVPAT